MSRKSEASCVSRLGLLGDNQTIEYDSQIMREETALDLKTKHQRLLSGYALSSKENVCTQTFTF